MSDRMPEYMPDRMSEYMSDKLSEYIYIEYTSWNVMMGITRIKVSYFTKSHECVGLWEEKLPAASPKSTQYASKSTTDTQSISREKHFALLQDLQPAPSRRSFFDLTCLTETSLGILNRCSRPLEMERNNEVDWAKTSFHKKWLSAKPWPFLNMEMTSTMRTFTEHTTVKNSIRQGVDS